MIMRTLRNRPKTTWQELVEDLKATGTTVTAETIGNTLATNSLTSCSVTRVQTCLRFTNEPLHGLERDWETVQWSDKTKI